MHIDFWLGGVVAYLEELGAILYLINYNYKFACDKRGNITTDQEER